MRLFELNDGTKIKTINSFTKWCIKKLGITVTPKISLITDSEFVDSNRTFGSTNPTGQVYVYIKNRNTADILRTLCHELVHCRQFELKTAGGDISDEQRQWIEDEANAIAGRILREYGQIDVGIYESSSKSGPDFEDTLLKTYVIPELPNQDAYLQYRFNVAMAAARGIEQRRKEGSPEFDPQSVWGENMIVVATETDTGKHIDTALKMMGIRGGKKTITRGKSQESSYVQKASPIKGFKGYPR
jgi:hypothetical protein